MNYTAGLVVLSCLVAVVFAQVPCPDCGPPTFPNTPCGVPDCSLKGNRHSDLALFAHPDPNFYWQCAPLNATHWAALARPCACGTVFNPNTNPPRCTFWYEDNWPQMCQWTRPPTVKACDPWCPDCDGDMAPPPPGPNPPGGNPPDDDGNNCECPCVPCVWWPCSPCQPSFNCRCNNVRRG